MSKKIFYKISTDAIGDSLSATPTIRKLSILYNIKLIIINKNIEIFKNNPYVDKVILPEDFDYNITSNDEFFESFVLMGNKNQFGIERHYNEFESRQIHANDLGFNLFPEESHYDFIPENGSENIISKYNIPKDYIVLNPATTWPNRTWNKNNWQKLINYLSDNKIFTVLCGKSTIEYTYNGIAINKGGHEYNNLYGVTLINKTSLSESWHILNNSRLLITMDTGLIHLAGTTDTYIVQLGSAKDPRLIAPYRHGTQNYKYTYLKGTCDIFCTNNMKYSIKEWCTINAIPPLIGCLENKPTFECHPTCDQVINFLNTLKW